MSKILWQAESGTLDSQMHIIEYLRQNGHTVRVDDDPGIARLSDPNYIEEIISEQYEVAIYTLHAGNPAAIDFVESMPFKVSIFMPHDLMADELDGTNLRTTGHKYFIAFTRGQMQRTRGMGLDVFSTEWYKLSMSCDDMSDIAGDPIKNAVIIDSILYLEHEFKYKDLFDKVFLKRWSGIDYIVDFPEGRGLQVLDTFIPDTFIKYGVDYAPERLFGMKGMRNAASVGKFWFTRESSMLAEAILVGCIPVLYEAPKAEFPGVPYLVKDIDIDGVLSKATVCFRVHDFAVANVNLLAVTENNLANKIDRLMNDTDVFNNTLKSLRDSFFPEILDFDRVESVIDHIFELEDIK